VAKIDEGDETIRVRREVVLAEETVVVANGSALVDDTKALEAGNFTSIDQRLALGVCCVRWDGQNYVLCGSICLHIELVEFLQVESDALLYAEDVRVSCLNYLEANFVVCEGHDFVRSKSLLQVKLRGALTVETEEAHGERNRILEVLLDLNGDSVSDKTLFCLVCNCDTAK